MFPRFCQDVRLFLLDEIDNGKSEDEVKVRAKKKRELICKWSAEAVKAA